MHRPAPSRSRRLVGILLLSVAVAALAHAGSSLPAGADGFNPFCGSTAVPSVVQAEPPPGLAPITQSVTAPGGTTTLFPPQSLFPIGVVDLSTGGPLMNGTLRSPIDVNGDGVGDGRFGYGLRASTSAAGGLSNLGQNPLHPLMAQTYRLPTDYVNPFLPIPTPFVGGSGVELVFARDLQSQGLNHKFEFGVLVDLLETIDGTTLRRHLNVRVGFDGRPKPTDPPGLVRQLPAEGVVSLLLRPGGGATGFLGVGIQTRYPTPGNLAGSIPVEQHPALGVSVSAEYVDYVGTNPSAPTITPTPGGKVLDANLDFSAAPGDFALGFRQGCQQDQQLAFADLTMQSVTTKADLNLDLDVDALPGTGLAINGSRTSLAEVAGRVEHLPKLVDVILQRDGLAITRSVDPTPAPTIRLDRFSYANDDPVLTGETPIFAKGRIEGLPEHVLLRGGFAPGGGIRNADVEAWSLACSGPDLPDDPLLPLGRKNCTRATPAAVTTVEATVQNFLPQQAASEAAMRALVPTLPPCSPTSPQAVAFALRQDLAGAPFQLGACLRNVKSGGATLPVTGNSRMSFHLERSTPGTLPDVGLTAGVLMVDGANHLQVKAAGAVVAAPADVFVTLKPTTTTGQVLVTTPTGSQIQERRTTTIDVAPSGSSPLIVDLATVDVRTGPAGSTLTPLAVGNALLSQAPPHVRIRIVTLGGRFESLTAEACPLGDPTGDPFAPSLQMTPPCQNTTPAARKVGLILANLRNFDFGTPAATDVPNLQPTSGGVFGANDPYVAFAYRGPRGTITTGNFRGAVRVDGLKKVRVDTTGTGTFGNPAITRSKVAASVDLANPLAELLLKVAIDGRTSLDEVGNTGFHLKANGLVTPLPAHIDATFESAKPTLALVTAEQTPFSLRWNASAPISFTAQPITGGVETVTLQGPGPDALKVAANLEVGSIGGAGGLAATGTAKLTNQGNLGTNGFGTVYRLAYSAGSPTVVRAGATISTATDRSPTGTVDDLRTRFRSTVNLPIATEANPLQFSLTERNGRIEKVAAKLCTASAGCASNRVVASVHRGRTTTSDTQLDQDPALPGVPTMGAVQPVVPGFIDAAGIGSNLAEGVHAVLLPDGTMGARLALRDIADFSATLDPAAKVSLRSSRRVAFQCTTNPLSCTPITDPFTVSVYAQPTPTFVPVFAAGRFNDLPSDMVVDVNADGGLTTDATPWVWVNTESTSILTPPNLTTFPNQPRTGVQLTGAVLVGNQTGLDTGNFDSQAPIPEGVRVRTLLEGSGSSTRIALSARLNLNVPRHIQIWQPTMRSCGGNGADTLTCPTRQGYERETMTRADVKVRTTAASLGALNVQAEVAMGRQRYQGTVDVTTIPGSLTGFVELTSNQRLPWATIRMNYATNVSPGTVSAQIFDDCVPAYVGDPVNSPELAQTILPGDCTSNPSNLNKVPNYEIILRNVPTAMDFQADIAASEAPNGGTPRPHQPCRETNPDYEGRGPTRLGYLHADLNLRNAARDIDVDVRTSTKAQNSTDNADMAAVVDTHGVSISGSVRAKLLNIGQEQAELQELDVLPFVQAVVDFGACLDLDLPIELTLTDVSLLRVRVNGGKLALDTVSPTTARVQGRIHERFTCFLSTAASSGFGCSAAQVGTVIDRNGAPFSHNGVVLEVRVLGGTFLSFSESGAKWKSIGLIDVGQSSPDARCGGTTSNPVFCWQTNYLTNSFDTNTLDNERGFQLILDPIWSSTTRGKSAFTEVRDNNGTKFNIGSTFYGTMDDVFVLGPSAFIPSLRSNVAVQTVSQSMNVTPVSLSSQARGSDGTVYRVRYTGLGAPCFLAIPTLEAWHTDSSGAKTQIRWVRALAPTACAHTLTLTPDATDGSLVVRVDATGTSNDRFARLDASGHGRVVSAPFTPTPVSATRGEIEVLTAPALGVGQRRVWYLGDGRTFVDPAFDFVLVTYDRVGTYYAIAVDYDSEGVPVRQTSFRVNVPLVLNIVPLPGVNLPSAGSSAVGETVRFVTTCGDPDGWRDLATIELAIGDRKNPELWLRFDQNRGLVGLYDRDTRTWQEGTAGSPVVLRTRFAAVNLAETTVTGSGPTGPTVDIAWSVAFTDKAKGQHRQWVRITDDHGETTGWDKVGRWRVRRA